MGYTRIGILAAEPRAQVQLTAGRIVPRLIERGPRSARVALVAGGALLLGGDRIDITISVGDGCTLEIEDIGGTVAYGGDGVASFYQAEITVGEGARLTWAGLPLIVADGADVHRTTRIRLAAGARGLVRESVVLGRSGEHGGRVRSRTWVSDDYGPVLDEAIDADGTLPVPGVLGAHRVFDTIVCAGMRPDSVTLPGATVMALDEPGAVARYLGPAAHASPLPQLWNEWAGSLMPEETSRSDALI